MEAAASISQALCDQGVSFRLCWNHGETIERFDVTQERPPEAVGALLRSRTMTGMGGSSCTCIPAAHPGPGGCFTWEPGIRKRAFPERPRARR